MSHLLPHPPFNHGKATTCHLTTEHKPLNGQFGSEEVAQLFYYSPMTKRVAAWSTAVMSKLLKGSTVTL